MFSFQRAFKVHDESFKGLTCEPEHDVSISAFLFTGSSPESPPIGRFNFERERLIYISIERGPSDPNTRLRVFLIEPVYR